MSPDRRRRAVEVLQQRVGVSQRRACRVVGQHRSAQRRPARPPRDDDEVLRARLRQISADHPRWGWRKAHAIAAREGLVVNRKRTRRLWLVEGLKRPARVRKKRRIGPARHQRLRAGRPDQMWALDFQVDVTADGRQVRFLNIVDEYTRQALATRAARSFTADATVAVLDELVTTLGRRPEHIRMDNGPELTAHALVDWCRYTGVDPAYIEPASPWQNGVCESFNGRFRDEFLACEQFDSLLEVQVLAEDWRIEYNTYRPPRLAGLAHPRRLPRAVDHQPATNALIAGGPQTGVQSHPLTVVRAVKNWTYQDVVDVIVRRVGNMAARREKAWRWEHWGVIPDLDSQLALAAELGIPEDHVSLRPWPAWLPDGDPISTAFGWTQIGSVEALADALERAAVDRRGFMKIVGSSLAGLAEEWRAIEPDEMVAVLRGGRATMDLVERMEEGLPRLRVLEATRGGSRARRLIDAELGMVFELLERSSYTTAVGKRLYSLAAELGRMAGWASFDAGLHAAAQRYWIAALHAAHTAGDRILGANILKSMSLQCYDFGLAREALELAQSAYQGAAAATPRAAAMLVLREARAHAALGDASACERSLAQADDQFGRAPDTHDDPAWLDYFDESEFCAQIGTCYLHLKRPVKADTYLDKTLRLAPDAKVRDRATYLIRRASAQSQLGDADQATAFISEAVPLIHEAPSERNVRRILRVRERLPFSRSDARGRDLDEMLAALIA